MYRVIRDFTDSCDDRRTIYRVGDKFPRSGYNPNDSRIGELLGTGNKQGVPLIERTQEKAKEDASEAKTDASPSKSSQTKGKPRKKQEKA